MKSISFKNIKRFTEFPEFKFSDITILVGANNVGKSTFAKIVDFAADGLKNMKKNPDMGKFAGGLHILPLINIESFGDYDRMHNKANDLFMELSINLGNNKIIKTPHRFNINIIFEKGEKEDQLLKIRQIQIDDFELTLRFCVTKENAVVEWVDIENDSIIDDKEPFYHWNIENFNEKFKRRGRTIDNFIFYSKKKLREMPDSEHSEYGSVIKADIERNSYARAERINEAFNMNECFTHKIVVSRDGCTDGIMDNSLTFLTLPGLLEHLFGNYMLYYSYLNKNLPKSTSITSRVKESAMSLEDEIKDLKTLKLPIHSLEKTPAFIQTHPLYNLISQFLKIEKEIFSERQNTLYGKSPKLFGDLFKELLNDLDIATDYRIKIIGGQVYTFEIQDKNYNWIYLSDIGSGALRLIEIILFVLTAPGGSILFIEEPEQNLHPKLQSKLADFFLKIKQSLGHQIIVETHSEYFVRRTQVLVAKQNYSEEDLAEKNPFKIYYFPTDGLPYDMKYQNNGCFEEKFGKGFFDEAANLAFDIL